VTGDPEDFAKRMLGTMWGEQTARAMLGEAGFTSIETTHLDGDIVNAYIIAAKG
jgi:hypothetical protein